MTADRLSAYVSASPAQTSFVGECWSVAEKLVNDHIGAVSTVPAEVVTRATIEVGAHLFHAQTARLGVAGLDSVDMVPIRVGRDPLSPARPILRPYLGGGFA